MHLVLPVHPLLVPLIGPAVTHGLSDLSRPLSSLWPYLLVPSPIPSDLSTAAFACASLLHFSTDIGVARSTCMHAVFVLLSMSGQAQLATSCLLLYMNFVHLPQRIGHNRLLVGVCIASALFLLAFYSSNSGMECVLPPSLQRLVVAHIVVDETRLRRP